MKTNNIYLPLIICSCLGLGFFLGGIFMRIPQSKKQLTENQTKQKLNKLIDFIDNEYVDDVNTDSIVDETVNGILGNLDPHSVYIAKSDAGEVAESMKGDFVGIGISFFVNNDTVTVIKPIKNGPSEQAGIKAGDRILVANNQKLFGQNISTEKLYAILKGKPESKVKMTIFRKTQNKKFNLTVTRNVVPIKSVDIAIMLTSKVGYIKINRFAETTFNEFKIGANKLQKQGATEMVIDLRDNGGGYLDQAISIADEFLEDKKLIVFTKNKQKRIDKTLATSNGDLEKIKVSILINENSASASEILAGAIQDNDRGLVIGRRSFGKGLVQREMPFADGSNVRLTIARYYTPTGRSIQKSYTQGNDEYYNEYLKRYQNGEMYAKDSMKIADTLKFKTPKGRIVYGGGGIFPDIFVGLEATKGSEMISVLMQSGFVSNFVFKEIDKNRRECEKLNFNQIIAKVESTESIFKNFKALIPNGTNINFDENNKYIKRFITAEFCRQILGENQYYQIILKEDLMVKKALL